MAAHKWWSQWVEMGPLLSSQVHATHLLEVNHLPHRKSKCQPTTSKVQMPTLVLLKYQ